ncbi:MAG: hypothetical protein BGO23_07915 [Solirubrobacterales bacterium 67-14]|nr:MAG: hypothetical protein BGO23_07915 [Solirubrobacterales bacterium 67-14]
MILAVALAAALIFLAHPLAGASDVFGNVGPAPQVSGGALSEQYPAGNFTLDQHFKAVEASLTGGVDVSGVPPMIAYFLASIIWELTAFLARTVISLFTFAFSLDLLNGSEATGGAGALRPVSAAIHTIYADVFGRPWLVVAVTVVGMWAMWRALIQRRYTETAGTLAVSLLYLIVALAFVAQPAATVGSASSWTNQMSGAFLSIPNKGSVSEGEDAKLSGADQLFKLLVLEPWTVLQFGGIEHCVKDGTGSEDSDPESVPVRPLSKDSGKDAALARALKRGNQVEADGKTCINNLNKYSSHFLPYASGSDERDAQYDALNSGDTDKLPDADPSADRNDYRLGIADKPATDAMEEGGQYQRLLVAIVVFVGELGVFLLIGALSVGVILAQILLLLLLAFAPVVMVLAVIPGRGHDFFRSWLIRLAGLLVRKAAYSLILAILLAVNGALAAATSQLGWLMAFGLQALFNWMVFLQRRQLTSRIVGAVGGEHTSKESSAELLTYLRRTTTYRAAERAIGKAPGRFPSRRNR